MIYILSFSCPLKVSFYRYRFGCIEHAVYNEQTTPLIEITTVLLFAISCAYSQLQVFGNIELNEDTAINHHNNFRTFLQALMLLFR